MKRALVIGIVSLILLVISGVISNSLKETSNIDYPDGKSVSRVDIIKSSGVTLTFGWSEPSATSNCLALPRNQTSEGFPFTTSNSTEMCGDTITNSTAELFNLAIWFTLLASGTWLMYVFLIKKHPKKKTKNRT